MRPDSHSISIPPLRRGTFTVNKHIAALALGTLAAFSPSALAGEGWHDDFDEAVKVASKEGKDLFVDFTGSDWCKWCIVLHEEVFDFEEWTEAVTKDYVLVSLDFPRSDEAKEKVPNPERNAELAKKYGVRGYPTILMMTVEGEVYAQTGYQKGGYEAYLEHMKEIREAGRPLLVEAKKLVATFEGAKEEAKVQAWEAIVAKLGELDAGSPFISVLAAPVRWAFEADPKNERGMKKKAIKILMKVGQADAEMIKSCHDLDPKNEEGLLEQAVEAQFMGVGDMETAEAAIRALDQLTPLGFKDQKVGFMLNFTAARWLAGPLKDEEAALEYALAAKKIGTDEERMMEGLEKLLEELQ
jgi:thioredoxin-related protein